MAKYTFSEYASKRQISEFTQFCVTNGIDLAPLIEIAEYYCENEDLQDEEVFNEMVSLLETWAGAALRGVGNAAGAAWGALRNGASSIGQGFQNGQNWATGQQPNAAQAPAANAAKPTNGMMPNGAINGQQLMKQVGDLTTMLGQINQSNAKIGTTLQTIQGALKRMNNVTPAAAAG